jgi:hypothetical protein
MGMLEEYQRRSVCDRCGNRYHWKERRATKRNAQKDGWMKNKTWKK